MSLDDTDQKIITALQEDPQITNKAIAGLVGISEPTVAQRIQSLNDRKVMRIVAQRDLYSAGYNCMCFAWIAISGAPETVADKISDLEETISVSRCAGSPQLLVNMRAADRYQLDRLVNEKLANIEGVERIKTSICLRILKFESGYGDLTAELPEYAYSDLDGRDRDIIRLLLSDGRMSNREIARRLEISEGNVRQRTRKLYENNSLRLGVVCDPHGLGKSAISIIRIAIKPAAAQSVISVLSKADEVAFLGSMSGDYNFWALVQMESQLEITNFVDRTIQQVPGVIETDVRQLVEGYMHRYDLIRIIS
ncbi:MAG: Lrp/AsnC family transcriptional regulator [Parvibaculaceae bacterium]